MRRSPVRPVRVLPLLLLAAVLLITLTPVMVQMPGESAQEPMADATPEERALAERLEFDVRVLADEIGERNLFRPEAFDRAADHIETRFQEAGLSVERESFEVRETDPGALPETRAETRAENLIAEIRGRQSPEEIVVVGAHYDTVHGSPGANDNASAVAALLALAEQFAEHPQPRTLRFVAFANEEPPFYMSADMGSHIHARNAREREEDIRAMMAMDGLGYFSDEPDSQQFPGPGLGMLYPDQANFIGFVSRLGDRALLRRALAAFRDKASIPSEGAALPAVVPGVAWSDHWSFWEHDYPAFFVTDTLPFRDPYYHSPGDTPERLDFERMGRVTHGLTAVIRDLAGGEKDVEEGGT